MAEIKLVDVSALQTMSRTPLTVADVPAEHTERYTQHGMDFNKDLGLKGKYCYHPFNTVTIDGRGDCYICTCQAWLPIPVGNIMDFNSLQDIVRSPKAREIQASIIDGSFKYCDHNTCHLIASDNLETRIDHRPDTINWIVFALDDSCNLSCPSCRKELIFHNKGEEFYRRLAISDHIVDLIEKHNHFLKFTLSGDGDPFASHIYRNMLEKLNLVGNSNVEIEIVTNGILVKSHWERMAGVHKNVVRMRISFDAGTPEVYAKTRRGGDWNKLIESCKHIIKWKKKNYSNMEIQAAFVVQSTNFRDIHRYVNLTTELGFDSILLQKVTDWGKWIEGGVNRFNDHAVWMPEHQYYQELVDILSDVSLSSPKVDLTNLSPLRVKQIKRPSLRGIVDLKTSVTTQLLPVIEKLKEYNSLLKHNSDQIQRNISALDSEFKNLNTLYECITDNIIKVQTVTETIVDGLDCEIDKITEDFYTQGYQIDGRDVLLPTDEHGERERIMLLNEESMSAISSVIQSYVNWKYPGLEINPRPNQWTHYLVGCDPLYLVDCHQVFLDETISQFSETYQRRIRPYLVQGTSLTTLPKNQFGFILVWNLFNFLTPDIINKYIIEIADLLRPGGVAMISYNNCERPGAASFAETGYMGYMTKTHLLKLIHNHGLELISSKDIGEAISWVEIRKPGELQTVKSHQALATIVQRE